MSDETQKNPEHGPTSHLLEAVFDRVKAVLRRASQELTPNQMKDLLKAVVAEHWPDMPGYTTLQKPAIEELHKSTVSTGLVLTFNEKGKQQVVLLDAGEHYSARKKKLPTHKDNPEKPAYMLPGGYINLTKTTGTQLVKPDADKGEDPRVGAVRELEEEVRDDQGNAILHIAPERLKVMDAKTITMGTHERMLALGFMVELDNKEVLAIKRHVARLQSDAVYKQAASDRTFNSESGKPEVSDVAILPLSEVMDKKHDLLQPGLMSLFENVRMACPDKIIPKHYPSMPPTSSHLR